MFIKANYAYSMLSDAAHSRDVEKILKSWPEVKYESTNFIKVENDLIEDGEMWMTCYLIVCKPNIWIHLCEEFKKLGDDFKEYRAI
jgi:hypothetical protein